MGYTRALSIVPRAWVLPCHKQDAYIGAHELFRCRGGNPRTISTVPHTKYNIDVKAIRTSPELYAQNCRIRRYEKLAGYPARIQAAHQEWLQLEKQIVGTRQQLKDQERTIARQAKNDNDLAQLLSQAKKLSDVLSATTSRQESLVEQIASLAAVLPNFTSPDTPLDDSPQILYESPIREELQVYDDRRDHLRIGTIFGLLDIASASTTSGWGFYFLLNEGEMLEHALINFARHVARAHGFQAVSPPSITYSNIGDACGFQPRDHHDEQQVYQLAGTSKKEASERPSQCLTGTGEIPFAGMRAGQILDAGVLPLKVAGASRCYRAEAGSRGRETRGLYRVHEFTKVELFAWTMPGKEQSVFDQIIAIQREILTGLGLPYRVLEMPAYELGASATRKQDIEVFFPSRRRLEVQSQETPDTSETSVASDHSGKSGWGEVTSASICTDYQTRRLGTRIHSGSRPAKKPFQVTSKSEDRSIGKTKKLEFASTVNGTALAVPRVLAAVLEHCWRVHKVTRDGHAVTVEVIEVPKCLWQWMDGITTIEVPAKKAL